ncbi:MAG: hypothetical protein A2Z72_02875 [Omnitrophica bacterium RBG_13_46_9]|nr:MAG: hypothetical protein A2Z72_02875 [Omnitrophica bacterium RBG_13_46_9]
MKFIDERGKLFGLVNIIDLSVILIVIAVCSTAYVGYKDIQARREDYRKKIYKIKVIFKEIPIDVANAVKVGDKEHGLVEITDIKRADVRQFVIPREIQKSYEKYEDLLEYKIVTKMIITFRALCFEKLSGIFISNQIVKIGKGFRFTPDLYDLEGVVIGIEEDTGR